MRFWSLDHLYLVFKWLNIPVTVTLSLSWSISDQKKGRVKVIPIYRKNGSRELCKSGYGGIISFKIDSYKIWLGICVE